MPGTPKDEGATLVTPSGLSEYISRVLYLKGGDDHFSRVTIARHLKRSTQKSKETGRLLRPKPLLFYLIFLRKGFAVPDLSPGQR